LSVTSNTVHQWCCSQHCYVSCVISVYNKCLHAIVDSCNAVILVMVWICRQFIWGKDWNWQWGCHGVSAVSVTEHQPSTYFDMKVWSCMFAVNVQSVSIQQVNWYIISSYTQT